MKGLVVLFLSVCLFGISWKYFPESSRKAFKTVVKENLMVVVLALLAVATAIFFSLNTTVKVI